MTKRKLEHETIVLQRHYDAPPARLFQAWEDADARMRWMSPSPTAEIIIPRPDFRVGGIEVSHCGPRGNPMFRVKVRYHDIVRDERIIFTEAVTEGGRLIAVSLVSVTFSPAGAGSLLNFTNQVTELDASDMIEGSRMGYSLALENLALELAAFPAGNC